MAETEKEKGIIKRIIEKILGTSSEGLGAAVKQKKRRKKELEQVAKETGEV